MFRKFNVLWVLLLAAVLVIPLAGSVGAQEKMVLHVGLEGEPTHLDPQSPPEDLSEYCTMPIADALVEYAYDGSMEVVPNLATEWEWVDGVTLKFKLREGVKFHNGREMVADDVKFSFERVMDPETASVRKSYLDVLDSVEVVDDYNGIFHLKESFAPFETYILQKIPIVPKEAAADLKTHPVGTGPFKFQEWVQGEKLVLVKNEDYWKEDKPYLDELVFQFMTNYPSLLSSFRAGNTDIITWLNNADAEPLEKEGFVIDGMPLYGWFYIGFNTEYPPFDDPKVRQAFKYAVDKQLVLDTAQMGLGLTGDINEGPDSPWYTDEFNYERDVEKAKEILAEAGFPDGLEAEFMVPHTPAEGPIGEAVAASVAEAGITLKINKLPPAEYIDAVFVRRDYPGPMICGYSGVPDPDFFDYNYLHSNGSWGVFNYSNPEVDKLLEEGRTTLDFENRKEIYQEVFRKAWAEDAVQVWLINEYRMVALQPYVKNWKWNKAKFYEYEDVIIEKE